MLDKPRIFLLQNPFSEFNNTYILIEDGVYWTFFRSWVIRIYSAGYVANVVKYIQVHDVQNWGDICSVTLTNQPKEKSEIMKECTEG